MRATIRSVATIRWDPLADLLALHGHIGQLVGTDAPGWTPPADLCEHAERFLLAVELPGLSREQIDIHAEETRIVVRGDRSSGGIPCEQYQRVERGHGRFQRTFILPEPIDVDQVSADLSDGVLSVSLPKLIGRGGRRVAVT